VNITDTIPEKMSDISKPQRRFIPAVLTTIMLMRGNVSFRNMSRYSLSSEKTFPRQFRNPSDSAQSNRMGTETVVSPHTTLIAATDCSFIPESGNAAYGLAMFYNGTGSEAEKGPGISQPAVADVGCNTAYSISAWQTPDTFISGHTARTAWYPGHSVRDARCLPPSVRYVASDGFYAEKKFADGVCDTGYHQISEPGHDANLRYLYNGGQKARGRHRPYDGKVCYDDSSRSGSVGETDNLSLRTAVVNSPSLKRSIRIVYPVRRQKHKVATALSFPTDIHLPAKDIYRFHKARFQPGCSVPGCGAVCRTSGLSGPP